MLADPIQNAGLRCEGRRDCGDLWRSVNIAVAGGALLCASVYLLVTLPKVSPLDIVHCVPAAPPHAQGETCFSSVNPVYPVVFLLSVAGTVIIFLGAFGKRFVVSPVFVAGMISLEYGLAGVVSGVLGKGTGVQVDPFVFSPLIAIGGVVICFQTFRRLRLRPAC